MSNSIQFEASGKAGDGPIVDHEEPGATAPLGNNAKFVSAQGGGVSVLSAFELSPPTGGRAGRFFLQSAARDLLPKERVSRCLRVPVAQVGVNWGLEHKRAFYSGLETCSSVWCCPVCGTKIAERRRGEVGAAIEVHICAGGVVVLVTFTIRHHLGDNLKRITAGMLEAHRKMRQGRPFQRFKQEMGYVGTIRALETTYGESNGWHPHIHELFFFQAGTDLGQVEGFLRSRWSEMLQAVGLPSVNQHGFKLDYCPDAAQTLKLYVTKLGTWDLSAEMTRAATKKARSIHSGRTPATLLYDYAMRGDEEAGQRWREYAQSFKGLNHLRWSPGLRSRLLPDSPELTDEQIAARYEETALVLASLNLSQWRSILGHGIRAELLDVADSGNPLAVWSFLNQFGIHPAEV